MRSLFLFIALSLVLASCSDDDDGSSGTPSNPAGTATLEVNGEAIDIDSTAMIAAGQGIASLNILSNSGTALAVTFGLYDGEGTYNFESGNILTNSYFGTEGFFVGSEDQGSGSLIITDHNTSSNRISGEYSFVLFDFTATDSVEVAGSFTNLEILPSFIQVHDIDVAVDGVELMEDHSFTWEDQSGGNRVYIRAIKDIGESVNITLFRSSTSEGTVLSGDFFSGPGPTLQYTVDGQAYDSTPGQGTFVITEFDPGVPFSEPGSIVMSMNLQVNDGVDLFTITGTVDATFGPE